ncbi:MAG: hypothetical protein WCJ30_26285 [Deltaproteobacteria bacterium]
MNLRTPSAFSSIGFLALAALLGAAACSSPTTDDAGDAGVTDTGIVDTGSMDTGTDAATDTAAIDTGTDTAAADTGPTADTGADTGSPTDGGNNTAACMAYCTTIMTNCTAANAQYVTMDACMGSCLGLPVGTAGATSGNSIACRAYHAAAAATGAGLHCPHAGPSGASVCGTPCEGFCAIAMHACTGANMEFASADACISACNAFATTPSYSTTTTSGNSYACRLYHLTVASSSTASAATHCPHIVAASPVCL